ncbi:MAG TPA: hypothetical protein VFY45_26670 [Baekduia sp.]|nr:hypothetical protein [Baekduia sp.]
MSGTEALQRKTITIVIEAEECHVNEHELTTTELIAALGGDGPIVITGVHPGAAVECAGRTGCSATPRWTMQCWPLSEEDSFT